MLTLLEQFETEVTRLRAQPFDGGGRLPQQESADWKLVDVIHEARNITRPARCHLHKLVEQGCAPLLAAKLVIALDRIDAMANGIAATLEQAAEKMA